MTGEDRTTPRRDPLATRPWRVRPDGLIARFGEPDTGYAVGYTSFRADAQRIVEAVNNYDRLRAIEEAARAYLDWRDKRAAQWDAVARHDHEHGPTPCPEWDELTDEPFDIDERLDTAIRAALEGSTP